MRKVAIIGTVGIPSKYGGFETLTEYLTKQLNDKFTLIVFCSSKSYKTKLKNYNGARLKYIPLNANGVQSVLYDIVSIFWALFLSDTLLILGVSGCLILPLIKLVSSKKIVVNIDGLEWKRSKWNGVAKKFLKFSESIAVKYADVVIADNKAIQKYTKEEYGVGSELIAYGADHCEKEKITKEILSKYPFLSERYAFKVCRIEPENNIKIILEAFKDSSLNIVVIGNWDNSSYGIRLKEEFKNEKNFYLIDPIYDQNILNQFRSNCFVYIHGHSAGGTNPSLVEAMFLELPIIAFDVDYNRETTNEKAIYFNSSEQLRKILSSIVDSELEEIKKELKKLASENYTWELISEKYKKALI